MTCFLPTETKQNSYGAFWDQAAHYLIKKTSVISTICLALFLFFPFPVFLPFPTPAFLPALNIHYKPWSRGSHPGTNDNNMGKASVISGTVALRSSCC